MFRMAVHASMRQRDHVAMLAVTRTHILLAPNSICGCEVGIECSHLYCLMIVLCKLQQASVPACLPAYLPTYLPTNQPTYLPTYLLTYLPAL